jgi:DNA-directed RNA polymerase specialized sigma subunit
MVLALRLALWVFQLRYMVMTRDIAKVLNYTAHQLRQKREEQRAPLHVDPTIADVATNLGVDPEEYQKNLNFAKFRRGVERMERQNDEDMALASVRGEGAEFLGGQVGDAE